MNNIEILENCWLMKTNHVLDEENKKVRQAIENLIQENKELKELENLTNESIKNSNFIKKNYIPKSKVKKYYKPIKKKLKK